MTPASPAPRRSPQSAAFALARVFAVVGDAGALERTRRLMKSKRRIGSRAGAAEWPRLRREFITLLGGAAGAWPHTEKRTLIMLRIFSVTARVPLPIGPKAMRFPLSRRTFQQKGFQLHYWWHAAVLPFTVGGTT
jgi:hypothetical protein